MSPRLHRGWGLDIGLRFSSGRRLNLGALFDRAVGVLAARQFGGDGGLGRLAPLGVDTCTDRSSLHRDHGHFDWGGLIKDRNLSAFRHPLVAGADRNRRSIAGARRSGTDSGGVRWRGCGDWHRFAISAHRTDGTAKAIAVGLAADPVSLLVLNARGVALDPNPELYAQVQSFLVGQAELSS